MNKIVVFHWVPASMEILFPSAVLSAVPVLLCCGAISVMPLSMSDSVQQSPVWDIHWYDGREERASVAGLRGDFECWR